MVRKQIFYNLLKVLLFIVLFYSCQRIEYCSGLNDYVIVQVKGPVCLLIEQSYEIENGEKQSQTESIFKFNRFNKLKSKKDGPEFTTYFYNDKGNIIVEKKIEKNQFSSGNSETVKKFYYDKFDNINKIDAFFNKANSPYSTAIMEHDEYNYRTKLITSDMDYVFDNENRTVDIRKDTVIQLYENEGKNAYTALTKYEKTKGIKTFMKFYRTDGKNITSTYIRKFKIQKDSITNVVDSNLVQKFMNIYKYDSIGNLIQTITFDSITHRQSDSYIEYVYDNEGNWITKKEFDNFHELKRVTTRKIEYFPRNEEGQIDFTWENETSPLEKEYEKQKERELKEKKYLNDDFILSQFYEKMKEYPNYKLIGKPKITYSNGCTYNINFNAYRYYFEIREKHNITVQIIMNLDKDAYTFQPIKGQLY